MPYATSSTKDEQLPKKPFPCVPKTKSLRNAKFCLYQTLPTTIPPSPYSSTLFTYKKVAKGYWIRSIHTLLWGNNNTKPHTTTKRIFFLLPTRTKDTAKTGFYTKIGKTPHFFLSSVDSTFFVLLYGTISFINGLHHTTVHPCPIPFLFSAKQ